MDKARESIGEARMLDDGTIVLWLRAESNDGKIGDGFLRYAPNDPRYEGVKKHIGDIKPGENKPVPPWKD